MQRVSSASLIDYKWLPLHWLNIKVSYSMFHFTWCPIPIFGNHYLFDYSEIWFQAMPAKPYFRWSFISFFLCSFCASGERSAYRLLIGCRFSGKGSDASIVDCGLLDDSNKTSTEWCDRTSGPEPPFSSTHLCLLFRRWPQRRANIRRHVNNRHETIPKLRSVRYMHSRIRRVLTFLSAKLDWTTQNDTSTTDGWPFDINSPIYFKRMSTIGVKPNQITGRKLVTKSRGSAPLVSIKPNWAHAESDRLRCTEKSSGNLESLKFCCALKIGWRRLKTLHDLLPSQPRSFDSAVT